MESLLSRATRVALSGIGVTCCLLAGACPPARAAGAPLATVQAPSGISSGTGQLNGTVDPRGEEVTNCRFEFSSASYQGFEQCAQGPGSGSSAVAVKAQVNADWTPGEHFSYSLTATNGSGSTTSAVFSGVTPGAEIQASTGTSVEGEVTLNGIAEPEGEAVASCEFEYGATESYGSLAACEPTPSPSTTAVAVHARLKDLKPGTPLDDRLVLTTSSGSVVSPNVSGAVPMSVSVQEASAVNVTSTAATLQAQILPGGAATTYTFEYGTTASYGSQAPLPAASVGYAGLGIAEVALRLENLQPETTYHFRVVARNAFGVATSVDQAFTTQSTGTPFALPDGRMWELVSPANKGGGSVETMDLSYGGDMQAAESGDAITYVTNIPVGAGAQSSPLESQVLSRRGPDGWYSESLTTPHQEASAKEFSGGSLPHFGQLAEYLIFSPNLALAWVEPEGHSQLAPEPVKHGGQYEAETYIRDNETGTFTETTTTAAEWYAQQLELAQGPPSCDSGTAPSGSQGVDAISRNGCYVFFNAEGAIGTLQVSHFVPGTGWTTTPVLPAAAAVIPWGTRHFELSPNGEYLAFMSNASPTGYDNRDAVSGALDEEVYLYDAATNTLNCVSCNPTGARPTGVYDNPPGGEISDLLVDREVEWPQAWLAGSLPEWLKANQEEYSYQPRYVTDQGRVFFNSPDDLVPQAVNGEENVYEYEPQDVGSCQLAKGCVSLISSGTSNQESAFVDASANGDDVFFLTTSRLVSADYDNNYDIYDAHVCSAEAPCPAVAPAVPPPCETSDSCKAPPTPQPTIFGAPPSATFVGAGNQQATPAETAVRKTSAPKSKRKSTAKRKTCSKRQGVKRRSCQEGTPKRSRTAHTFHSAPRRKGDAKRHDHTGGAASHA